MGHVNNAVYLDWLEEGLVEAGAPATATAVPRRASIEYAASAEPGDTLATDVWRDDAGDAWWARIFRPADGATVLRARVELPRT
jgi:acyl-ACP thioesterase